MFARRLIDPSGGVLCECVERTFRLIRHDESEGNCVSLALTVGLSPTRGFLSKKAGVSLLTNKGNLRAIGI